MADSWDSYNYTVASQSSPQLPDTWKIAPLDVLNGDIDAIAKCPKTSTTFIAFAISNVIVTVVGILLGCRPIIHKLSCHVLGKRGKQNTILYNWIFPLALHVGANALVGVVIHNTPGYENVKVQDAMMIYFVRPRISVLALATMSCFFMSREDYPWMYALLANTIAEFILQVIADIWVIYTGINRWNTTALGIAAAMCISTGLFFIVALLIVIASRPYDSTGGQVFHIDYAAGFKVSNSFGNRFCNWFAMMMFGVPSYLISWGFFTSLITTAKTEWCPPKLAAQVAIWVLFPLLGTIFGVAVC
ncbi:uncharacterized protein BDR25DRAFT_340573 [Lindgomyces ingoldianus]|uniref:Uncharacterized protein n=1 Tax=Lindgomyces ingoldianus TaxID=673940 RepID=A0ACB6R6K5_9PLEO|nr:uncharacterized protein BDR25DRAFT_340573 [Lindgomyces ingoldianus]KAF2474898.1 hypothetical protein BDR25DRAFT_340573 [Lindgomyces ingoldianus]